MIPVVWNEEASDCDFGYTKTDIGTLKPNKVGCFVIDADLYKYNWSYDK